MAQVSQVTVLLLLWCAGVITGCGILLAYGGSAGAAGVPLRYWPEDSAFVPDPDRYTLIMFAHPRCPCTRASLGELARLTSNCGDHLTTVIALYAPKSEPADWSRTALRAMADQVPGASVVLDPDGSEASRFGSATSGHVLLYDAERRLRFSGGITASRGHEGDNAGRTSIERLVSNAPVKRDTTPVFGCPLLEPGACCPEEDS